MDRPLVSVITPTYNHESFILQCLDSVLSQTFEDWEQIIVDDGSTDKTAAIVARYAAADRRIHLIRQRHKGIWRLSEAYNSALERARGKYIAILEGDDFWPSYKLGKQISFHDDQVLLSYGDTQVVESDGTPRGIVKRPGFSGVVGNVDFLRFALLTNTNIRPQSAICDTIAVRKLGGFHQDNFPAVDWPTFVRLAQLSGCFVFQPVILGCWRQHSLQVTGSHGIELAEGRLRIALEQYAGLSDSLRQQLHISEQRIVASHAAILADTYLCSVRSALKDADRAKLEYSLARLWRYGSAMRKAQAVYALLAMKAGWDMEWIYSAYSLVQRVWSGTRQDRGRAQ